MNQQQYRALTGWARRNPARQQVMTGLCRLLPYSLFFFTPPLPCASSPILPAPGR